MPTAEGLKEQLRRFSAPKVFRRSSKADGPQQLSEKGRYDDTPTRLQAQKQSTKATLFALPTELLAPILQHVTFKTLCAIRLTCRDAHHLLSEGDIIRQWIGVSLHPRQTELYPPPNPATFIYVAEQERRASVVRASALLYADFIETEIVRQSLRRRNPFLLDIQFHSAFRPVRESLALKLVPLLLTLQHYLESFADAILETCKVESPHHSLTFRRQHEAWRHHILEQYDLDHLLQVYKFWLFLSWVNNAILNRPSYVGTFERAVRGWSVDPLREYDISLALLFGHFSALGELVRTKSFNQRRKLVEVWVRRLDPASNVCWRDQWNSFSLKYEGCPIQAQAEAALQVKLQTGEVFANSARVILVEQGLVRADDDMEAGTAQQCSDFLREIAGYDVLNLPPSMAPGLITDGSFDFLSWR